MSIQCGAAPCPMPMACCRPIPAAAGKKDAGAGAPTCVVACDYAKQEQLCSNDDDCQAGPQYCVQGICADNPAPTGGADAGGEKDAGTAIRDGGRG
jgi:hypothetical protein